MRVELLSVVMVIVVWSANAWADLRMFAGGRHGLDRADQRTATPNSRFSQTLTGRDVTIYFIDDGCEVSHPEFVGASGSRLQSIDFTDNGLAGSHGTQMAGLALGLSTGVATRAQGFCLDVINGTGGFLITHFAAAVNFILARPRTGREVVNLSLESFSGVNLQLEAEVQRLLDAGLPVVVAAGNGATDASGVSPARMPNVITVGNVRTNAGVDEWFATSNFGAALALLAPGVSLQTALNGGGIGSSGDGTSASAAVVSGHLACLMETSPGISSLEARQMLVGKATTAGVAGLPPGTTSRIVFSDFVPPNRQFATPGRMGGTSSPSYMGQYSDGILSAARRMPENGTVFVAGYADATSVSAVCGMPPRAKTVSRTPGYVAKVTPANGAIAWRRYMNVPGDYCGTPLGSSHVRGVTSDAAGNAVVVSEHWNGLTKFASVSKLDGATGATVWTTVIGSTGTFEPTGVTGPDYFGAFFVVGAITGADVAFTVPFSSTSKDVFIARVDSAGSVSWGRRFGTSGIDVPTRALVSGSTIYVAGSTTGGMGSANAGGSDGFVLAYNMSSQQTSVFQRGSSGDDVARDLRLEGSSLYVAGQTGGAQESIVWGTGGGSDGFIWKLSIANPPFPFVLEFSAQIGSGAFDSFGALDTVDVNGQVFLFVVGETRGEEWAANPLGDSDVLVAKVSIDGLGQSREIRWVLQSGSTGAEVASAVVVESPNTVQNQPGRLLVGGTTSGAFPEPTVPLGASDGFFWSVPAF